MTCPGNGAKVQRAGEGRGGSYEWPIAISKSSEGGCGSGYFDGESTARCLSYLHRARWLKWVGLAVGM